MKPVNALAQFLRDRRLEVGSTQGDVADELDISVPFWSAIENGKKPLPKEKMPALITALKLGAAQVATLKHLAEVYKNSHTVDVSESRQDARELMAAFARRFDSLSEEDVRRVFKAIGEKTK